MLVDLHQCLQTHNHSSGTPAERRQWLKTSSSAPQGQDILRSRSNNARSQVSEELHYDTYVGQNWMEIWNGPLVISRAPLQTLWGSNVKLGRSRLPASAWLSCSTSYMLYDGFPISTLMPPLVMGCLWTRFPLRSHTAWLKWILSFSQFSGFILQMTDLSSAAAAVQQPLYLAPRRLFAYLCLRLQT